MPYVLTVILLSAVMSSPFAKEINDTFPVGNYSLHFNQGGEVIKPDEYYVYKAVHDNEDGFKKSAIKNFQKAASYGNTFAVYYTGLLFLQEEDIINGYAWLSMVETRGFPHSDNTLDLLNKLKSQLKPEELKAANIRLAELNKVYGATPAFARRKAWSKDFKLTGSHLKGYVPHRLQIQTDWSHGKITRMSANVVPIHIEIAIRSFIYEYELDYRITYGDVKLGEFEVIETDD